MALAPPRLDGKSREKIPLLPKRYFQPIFSQFVVEAQTIFLPCMEYTPCTFSSFKNVDCFSLELYHIISFSNHTKNMHELEIISTKL